MTEEKRRKAFPWTLVLGANGLFVVLMLGALFELLQDQKAELSAQKQLSQKLIEEAEQGRREWQQKLSQQQQETHALRLQWQQTLTQLESTQEALLAQQAQQHQGLKQNVEALIEGQRRDNQAQLRSSQQQWLEQWRALQADLRDQHQALSKLKALWDMQAPFELALPSSVRVNARSEVGSGVVLFSGRRQAKGPIETYVLTAYHVIKDNLASGHDKAEPVQIDFYSKGRKSQTLLARIVELEAQRDLALLQVHKEVLVPAANLASAEDLRSRTVLSRVLTVGCPLGYAPMPTLGQITSKNKTFDDQSFWMINASTIFGNSGGGVYDGETGRLLGVLIRIAAYKNVIDVAVPHLGIVTPLSGVREWLQKTPHSFLLEPQGRRTQAGVLNAGRKKASQPSKE